MSGDPPAVQDAPPSTAHGSAWWARAALVAALVAMAVLDRFDTSVRLAYQGNWLSFGQGLVSSSVSSIQAAPCDGAVGCPRLPGNWWWVYVLLSVGCTLAVAGLGFELRTWVQRTAARAGRSEGPVVARLIAVVVVVYLLAGGGLAYARAGFALGEADSDPGAAAQAIVWLKLLSYVALGLVVLLAVRTLVMSSSDATDARTFRRRLLDFAGRQRLVLSLLVVYVACFLVVPIAKEQMLDALRLLSERRAQPFGQLMFLVATTALLSVVVFEVAVRVDTRSRRPRDQVPYWIWFVGSVVATSAGLLLAHSDVGGRGLLVLGGLLLVIALLQLGANVHLVSWPPGSCRLVVRSGPEPDSAGPATQVASVSIDNAARAAALLAAVPLVTVAMALAASTVEVVTFEEQPLRALATAAIGVVALVAAAVRVTAGGHPWTHVSQGSRWWSAVVALVILITGGLLAWREPGPVWTTAVASVAAVGALLLLGWMFRPGTSDDRSVGFSWTISVALWAGIGTTVVVHMTPIEAPQSLGTVALLNVFVGLLLWAALRVTLGTSRFRSPETLNWLGVQRLPLVTILVIWWVVAGLVLPDRMHDVRVTVSPDRLPTPRLEQAFDSWVAAQPEFSGAADAGSSPAGPVPLVLVASRGGGIRAAYWTALVMDCLVGVRAPAADTDAPCEGARRDPDSTRRAGGRFFLASGVSGGGVGVAAYASEMLDDGELAPGWPHQRLGEDFLAPVAGWGLFHDLPNHLLGIAPGIGGGCRLRRLEPCWTLDRAAILEQSLDRKFGTESVGLRELWAQRESADPRAAEIARALPLVAINASMPTSPYHALVSPADLSDWPREEPSLPDAGLLRPVAGSADLVDMLCSSRDVRLSTAAVLGARFPLVSPSGHMAGTCGEESADLALTKFGGSACAVETVVCDAQMVDGGYIDNSGLLTISRLLPELSRLVADQNELTPDHPISIVVVDIDSHYETGDPDGPPAIEIRKESLLPAQLLTSGRKAVEESAEGAVLQALGSGCLVSAVPASNPGVLAPLGWTLSGSSESNLEAALRASGTDDERADALSSRLERLRLWLEPTPTATDNPLPELAACPPE